MHIADLCTIQTGYTVRRRLQPVLQGGVLVIQLRDVAADGEVNPDTLTRVELGELPDRYFVRAGDVVFRTRGDRNIASALVHRLPQVFFRQGRYGHGRIESVFAQVGLCDLPAHYEPERCVEYEVGARP